MIEHDLEQRKARIRQRELLLALELYGLSFACEVSGATEAEQGWLQRQARAGAIPQPARTADEVREAGRRANAMASSAFMAGEYDKARELTDEAFACGALFESEWVRLHEYINTKSPVAAQPRMEAAA